MKKGDLAFFYHSNEGVEIVGIVKICKEHYQDPTTTETAWVVVDVSPVKKLKRTIPLSEIKGVRKLQNMALLKQSRLSVQPVTAEEWETILQLAEY